MSQTPDYSTWLTKQQAADAIGVTTKSVERFVQAGQIQQARWQRAGRGPLLAVYHPADVARIASARRTAPEAFVLGADAGVATNGNGHGAADLYRSHKDPLELQVAVPPGDEVWRALLGAALHAVLSQTSQTAPVSQTLFLTLPEAAAASGLSQVYLRRRIADGTLQAERDRGWKIRRKDLEAL